MSLHISFDDKQEWAVDSDIWQKDFKSPPFVRIPIDQLQGLTTEEIGKRVTDCVECARYCHALEFARIIRTDGNYYTNAPASLIDEWVVSFLPLLSEFIDIDSEELSELELAYRSLLVEAKTFLLEQQRRRIKLPTTRIREVRRTVANNYDALFLEIGKRDGFHCGACRATERLEIDHILPVSHGGESDSDNLQLLCKSCNVSKGARNIDYRNIPQIETEQ